MSVTVFVESIQAPSIRRIPSAGLLVRSFLSLLAVCAILVVAIPTALGAGAWNGGIDVGRFFSKDAPARVTKAPAPPRRPISPIRP